MNEFTSCLTSSLNISNSNAEYFKENIQIIMDNRQDGMGLMWKWVREINPNANYKEVADLFKSMQQMYSEKRDIIIKANADIFMLQKRDKDLITKFPSSEVNPNANFNEVSEMFQHMQSLYLEKRSSIIAINKTLFELEKRDANLRTMFPSNMIINLVGETEPLIRK